MKYCDNCGAQMEDSEEYCPECGEKMELIESGQVAQPMHTSTIVKAKKKSKIPVTLMIILLVVVMGVAAFVLFKQGVFTPKEVKEPKSVPKTEGTVKFDESNLFGSLPWEETEKSTEKIEKFKEQAVFNYPGISIEKALSKDYVAPNQEGYCSVKEEKYYYINYNYDGSNYISVFQQDKTDKVTLVELQIDGQRKEIDSEEHTAYLESVFSKTLKVAEEEKKLFDEKRIGYFSNDFWGMDIKSIDNKAKTIVYDGYELGAYYNPACTEQEGEILDANTLKIGSVIIPWEGETFTLSEGTDAMVMSSQMGGTKSHDVANGAGVYKRQDKPVEKTSASSAYPITAGKYLDKRLFGQEFIEGTTYYIVGISNVTEKGFDFNIKEYGGKLVFEDNTAVYTGDGTATFYGKEYTLYFSFNTDYGLQVSGFNLVEGFSFFNNAAAGVS